MSDGQTISPKRVFAVVVSHCDEPLYVASIWTSLEMADREVAAWKGTEDLCIVELGLDVAHVDTELEP